MMTVPRTPVAPNPVQFYTCDRTTNAIMASTPAKHTPPFVVRIVSIDYYMAAPLPGVDVNFNSVEGTRIEQVPVVRIFGSTPAGQKACLHVHQVSQSIASGTGKLRLAAWPGCACYEGPVMHTLRCVWREVNGLSRVVAQRATYGAPSMRTFLRHGCFPWHVKLWAAMHARRPSRTSTCRMTTTSPTTRKAVRS